MAVRSSPGRPIPALTALRVNVIVDRAQLRISQVQLAQRSGVSRPTISRIESGTAGDVSVWTVQRLADALGRSVSELFVPASYVSVGEGELARRATAPDSEFVDADDLFAALAEANREQFGRYSRAGRPLGNRSASRSPKGNRGKRGS